MNANTEVTPKSLVYRRRAAKLASQADVTDDLQTQASALKQALEWIMVAENEEILSAQGQVGRTMNDNVPDPETGFS